jgi:hypothetical protein
MVGRQMPNILRVSRSLMEEHRDTAGKHGIEDGSSGVGVTGRLHTEHGIAEEFHEMVRLKTDVGVGIVLACQEFAVAGIGTLGNDIFPDGSTQSLGS